VRSQRLCLTDLTDPTQQSRPRTSGNRPGAQGSMSLPRSTKDLSFPLNKVRTHAQPGMIRALCVYSLHRQPIFVGCGLIFLTGRSAHPRSMLVFHLKQYHRIRPDSSIGSIRITVEELLNHCRNGERMSCCISYSCCDFHSG